MRVDRWETGRARRREQAEEALRFEQDRRLALEDQRVDVITETVTSALDAAALAALTEREAEIVRDALGLAADWSQLLDEEEASILGFLDTDDDVGEDDAASAEEEITRLDEEIAESREREAALARYLAALATVAPPTD